MPFAPIIGVEGFKEPDPKLPLWRYFDIYKFLYLLENSSLFFSTLESLSSADGFEGSLTIPQLKMVNRKFEDLSKLQRKLFNIQSPEDLESFSVVNPTYMEFNKVARKITYANCWHANHSESKAMWEIYGNKNGIAIKTTLQRLKASLTLTEKLICIGKVTYIDFKTHKINSFFPFMPAFFKNHGYKHEDEVRLMYYEDRRFNYWMSRALKDDTYVLRDNKGLPIKVDLNVLINNIYVAPAMEKWNVKLIRSILQRYGYNKSVICSGLL